MNYPVKRSPGAAKALLQIGMLATILLLGCTLTIKIVCNGVEYATLVELSFVEEENQTLTGTDIFGSPISVAAAGAHLEVGLKPISPDALRNCCPNGRMVWRQWTRSNKSVRNVTTGGMQAANTWYADALADGSRNLPTYPPTSEQAAQGYTERFVDRPARSVSSARDSDLEWEAVTVFGCLTEFGFKPLAAFTWGWEMDDDGDVDLSSPSELSMEALSGLGLP